MKHSIATLKKIFRMKKIVILFALSLLNTQIFAQPKTDIYTYINQYQGLAISEMQRTGVPASIKLAQGIHETFAGKSELVLKSNNHFGIKCKTTWTGNKVYHDDDAQGECFRSYSSSADSYVDHSNFLRNGSRYSFLFEYDPTDYRSWAYGLKKAGYATNVKYSQIIIKLIEDYNLNQYSLIALNKLSPEHEVFAFGITPTSKTEVPTGKVIAREGEVIEVIVPVKYPDGEFLINNTRVIFGKQGTSLLSIAEEYNISLSRLLDFNDLNGEDILLRNQLVYLQRKRKTGLNEFHIVQKGESLYDIAQKEGIRLKNLLDLNFLQLQLLPASGEKLYLHEKAPGRPRLVNEIVAQVSTTIKDRNDRRTERILHTVRLKETLYSISKRYAVDIDLIREWNKLSGFDLKIGQELVIYKQQ